MSKSKSQSAIEFVTLFAFMTIVLVGFYAITTTKTIDVKEEDNRKTAEDIADFALKEIELAKSVNDGYSRVFSMPPAVSGINYTIDIVDNRELVVKYLGYEHVRFLPANVTGNIFQGANLIYKLDGMVHVNGSAKIGQLIPVFNLLMGRDNIRAITFDEDGNIIAKGNLYQNQEKILNTGNDEFIIKDDSGNTVLRIDLVAGGVFIKGRIYENQVLLNPDLTASYLIIKNLKGEVVVYVDSFANIYIKGTLTQNGNPQ